MFSFRAEKRLLSGSSCPVWHCLVIPCLTLPCLASFCVLIPFPARPACLVLPYPALPCLEMPCSVLICLALPCSACLTMLCTALLCLDKHGPAMSCLAPSFPASACLASPCRDNDNDQTVERKVGKVRHPEAASGQTCRRLSSLLYSCLHWHFMLSSLFFLSSLL